MTALARLRRENNGHITPLADLTEPRGNMAMPGRLGSPLVRSCQWIDGEPTKFEIRTHGAENFKCGHATRENSPYCELHHKICYRPPPPLEGQTNPLTSHSQTPMRDKLRHHALAALGDEMVKSASGKVSGGIQGVGKPSRPGWMTTSPSKAKPSTQLTGEKETKGGGRKDAEIANARGGTMNHPRGYGDKPSARKGG